jgi:hypothetical protein
MSYKQFIQELEDDVLPAEAERRYEIQSTQITLEFDLEPSFFSFFFFFFFLFFFFFFFFLGFLTSE